MSRSLLVLVLACAAGCGSPPRLYGDNNAVGPVGGGADMALVPDLAMAASSYPPGPYGNQQGTTLRDLTVAGYRLSPAQTDATRLPWDPSIKLSDFHTNPACKCLLLTIGATWCGACQDEQPALIADVTGDPSFCVLSVLQEGLQMNVRATRADVDAWVQQFMQNFYVVQGDATTDHLSDGYGPTISLPFNFIVRPDTMKVLDVVMGYRSDIHPYATGLCRAP